MDGKRIRERVVKPQRNEELKVFISTRESICDECGENLGSRAWITLAGEKGALCLTCADLDHLVFLPSGDAALTRRARKVGDLGIAERYGKRLRLNPRSESGFTISTPAKYLSQIRP